MNKNLITILVLTLITLITWGALQLFKIRTSYTIPQPTQEQINPLNPNLDKNLIETLKETPE